ncbi:FAD-dependent monooxygenase [Polymorphospora rubra]|uniref:FAD-dependent monooxygenase n=1 Tax=Polymorphospora rubra TaxID=338584 RepID=UPI0033E3348E
MSPTVLISGAGIAGPVLAYWLSRHGFTPTVVERAPGVRHTGGHAVDLGGVSTEVIERMGLLPAVQAARVRRDTLLFHRADRPPLAMPRLSDLVTDRHVEIQRDDLIAILHEATREQTEYVFGETITAVHEHDDGVTVTFADAPARDFDLLVGADGLHSGVRRMVFGPEQRFRHDLGGYLAVFSYPNELGLDRQVLGHLDVDRAVFTYAVDDGARARTLLLFRHPAGAGGHTDDLRDPGRRTRLLRDAFGESGWHLPRLLAHADGADDLYVDSISQIRMDTWSRGRVTLVGDAGYSPGPAVGGGTALAVLGGYVLAHELALAGGDHHTAFRGYEQVMREPVARGRRAGPDTLRQLVPGTRFAARTTPHLMRLFTRLPRRAARTLAALQRGDTRTLDDFSSTKQPGSS